MNASKLKCPNCGAPIPGKNINIQKMAAVCESCDSVFAFDNLPTRTHDFTQAHKNKRVPKPANAILTQHDNEMSLKIPWSIKTEAKVNLVIMGIWLAIALVIPLIGFMAGEIGIPLMIGALMGAFPAYYFLSVFVNSTQVRIENGILIHEATPLYMPGAGKKQIPLDEIVRIYAEPSHYYGLMQQDISLIRREDMYYDIMVELTDGSRVRLTDFFHYSHAFYIVQEVENYLHEESNADVTLFDSAIDALTLQDSPLIDGELPIPVDDDDLPHKTSLKN